MSKKVYLAIPYTWNPNRSFEIANKVAARLMNEGYVVFSPVSHSHPIADHMDEQLRINNKFWMKQDLPLVDWADELHIVCIGANGQELIDNSKGVQMEFNHAVANGKKIKVIDFYE